MIESVEQFTEPSRFYLDALDADTARRSAEAVAAGGDAPSPFAGAPESLQRRLSEIVDELRAELVSLLHDLHDHPETAFEEHRSAAVIAALLRRHGLDAKIGVHGLDTAIRAEIVPAGFDGSRDRTIAVLAEYDALPGIGHGCGHNVIAATGTGAALALGALLHERPDAFRGRIVFLGTPAEEGRTGKEYLARGGAFEGVDAAVMLHPYGYDLADQVWLGRRLLSAVYEGRAAHASAQPFQGRNALDAAVSAYQGIGLLRQQLLPVDRVHAIISDGGTRPSVIPARAQLDLYVRSKFPETLLDLSGRIEHVLRGAAEMTGTNLTLDWDRDPPSLPVRTNGVLTSRWVAAERRRGRSPLPLGVVPETVAASTDFGNVSFRVPGMHPLLKISAPDVALHTVAFRDAAESPAAEQGAVDGAYGLAATALDFLADDALAAAARAEFDAAGGSVDVKRFFAH